MVSGLITAGIGFFPMIFIPRCSDISLRESVFIVAFGWTSCTLAGALPFYLHGLPFTAVNAVFESISGYTTTGASILQNIEELPHGLLLWRSCTEWLGGIGIISFALAVMPRLGQVSRPIFQQEYTGLAVQPVFAKASDVLRGLFSVYLGLTIAQVVALASAGMPLFDAVNTALATLPTGGFTIRNASVASYDSVAVDAITIVFMLLGGMNFVFLHYLFTRPGRLRQGLNVAVLYLATIFAFSLLVITLIKGPSYASWGDAIRYGTFQVVSLATTTGFATADSTLWPVSAQIVILMVTIIGACSGSTAGGIKYDRILLFFKLLKFRFQQLIHPGIVPSIRVDKQWISLENAERAVFYIAPFLAVLALSTLLLSLLGIGSVEAFSGSVACLANAGPGMGVVGSMGNYSGLPDFAKAVLSVVMLLGRLEIFALVLPFTPGFWRR